MPIEEFDLNPNFNLINEGLVVTQLLQRLMRFLHDKSNSTDQSKNQSKGNKRTETRLKSLQAVEQYCEGDACITRILTVVRNPTST